MTYKVQIEQFEGPLDLLLGLIESEELEISNVSIAQVTDQFIAHMNQVEDQVPDEVVDFLVVASKLLLIKSKTLLPLLELDTEDEGTESLEDQLRQYKKFVDAAKEIKNAWRPHSASVSREKIVAVTEKTFTPPPGISASLLEEAFKRVLGKLQKHVQQVAENIQRTISIKEKIGYIKNLLFQKMFVGFKNLVGSKKDKTETIVAFLALLELVKQKAISVEQQGRFEDITLRTRKEKIET